MSHVHLCTVQLLWQPAKICSFHKAGWDLRGEWTWVKSEKTWTVSMFSVVPESKLLFKWGKECQTLESKGKDDRKSLPNRLLCVQATVRCLSGTCAADLNPTTYRLFEREGVTGGTSCTTGYKSSSHLQKIFLFLVQQSKPNTWGEKKKKTLSTPAFLSASVLVLH